MEQTILPIAPQVFWGLVTLAGIVAGSFLIGWAMPRLPRKDETPPLDRLKSRMGLDHLNAGLFLILLLLWAAIFLMLVGGFLILLWTIIWQATPATPDQVWDWRFSLAKLTALTATLGAVVAFPFTLIRIRLTRRQTETAEEALFNDKINAAATDLAARREVTRVVEQGGKEVVLTEWEDDLVTRAAAIDRLEGLASERPNEAGRIARQLSIYVRELSREFPAKELPDDIAPEEIHAWIRSTPPARPDMEKAAQSLGRLQKIDNNNLVPSDIDLRGANLQGFDLSESLFNYSRMTATHMQGAYLYGAEMQGANLIGAQMQGAHLDRAQMQGVNLNRAQMQGVFLRDAQMQRADLNWAQMQEADLYGAQMQGADLNLAQLQNAFLFGTQMQGADLNGVQMQGALLNRAQMDEHTSLIATTLRGAAISEADDTTTAQLQDFWDDVFADGSVQLPEDETRPSHWENDTHHRLDFDDKWRAWQATLSPE